MFLRRFWERQNSILNTKTGSSKTTAPFEPLPRRTSSCFEPIRYKDEPKWTPVSDPPDLSWEDIEILVSNRKEFEKHTLQYIGDLRKFLVQNVFRTLPYLEPPDIVEVVCKLIENGYGIRANSNTCYGYGIYPTASYFNHSCAPNLAAVQEGLWMDFYALVDIPEGTEVTISYIPLTSTTQARREYLAQEYFFYCTCPRCMADSKLTHETEFRNRVDTKSLADDKSAEFCRTERVLFASSHTSDSLNLSKPLKEGESSSESLQQQQQQQQQQSTTTLKAPDDLRDEFLKKFVCSNPTCEGKGLFIPTARGPQCNLCRQFFQGVLSHQK
jgi:hypothetical protein